MGAGGEKDVKLTVGISGGEEIAAGADKALSPWESRAQQVKGVVKQAGAEIGRAFQSAASDMIRTVTVANTISFGQALGSAKQFREEIGRVAQSYGGSLGALQVQIDQIGRSKLIRDEDAIKAVRSIKSLTYDTESAVASLKGLGTEALASGKSIEDMVPIGATLRNALGVVGDTSDEFGVLRAQVDALDTSGGTVAFHDRLVGISGILSEVSAKTDEERHKITALAAGLGKGLTPEQGARVTQRLVGDVASDSRGYERFLGMERGSSLDEQGHVKDPLAILEQTKAKLLKMAGGDKATARYLASGTFGNEASAALFSAEFDEIRNASKLGPSAKGKEQAEAFRKSAAGQEIARNQERERQARASAEKALPVSDFFGDITAKHPILGALGLTGAAQGVKALAGKAWGGLFGGGGAAAAGGGVGAVPGSLGTAGGSLAGLLGSGAAGLGAAAAIPLGQAFAATQLKVDPAEYRADAIRGGFGSYGSGVGGGRRHDAELIARAGMESGDIGEFVRSMGPGVVARAGYDPAMQRLAQQASGGEIDLSSFPDDIRQGVMDALKASPQQVNITVTSADGTPITAVETSKAGSPRN